MERFMNRIPVVVIALFFVVASIFAQPEHPCQNTGSECQKGEHRMDAGDDPFMHHGEDGMLQKLGVSEKQSAELKVLKQSMTPVRKKHREEMSAIREKVRLEFAKPNSDRKIIERYSREMADVHYKMAEAMADHILAVKKVLTPDQFEKMNQMIAFRKGAQHQKKGIPPNGAQ